MWYPPIGDLTLIQRGILIKIAEKNISRNFFGYYFGVFESRGISCFKKSFEKVDWHELENLAFLGDSKYIIKRTSIRRSTDCRSLDLYRRVSFQFRKKKLKQAYIIFIFLVQTVTSPIILYFFQKTCSIPKIHG